MISFLFASAVLALMLYVHQRCLGRALDMWQRMLKQHPSMRVVAARNLGIIDGHRKLLGRAIAVQSCVVAALGYLVLLRHLVRHVVALWGTP